MNNSFYLFAKQSSKQQMLTVKTEQKSSDTVYLNKVLIIVLLLRTYILLQNCNVFLSQFLQIKPNSYVDGL